MSSTDAGAETSARARVPSEWIAALAIVVAVAAIRVALGAAVVTLLALAGLLPLVAIYCMMGTVRRLPRERLELVRARYGRRASLLVVGVAFLAFPLLLFAGPLATSEGAVDRGLGLGLGGYFIALLELGQLYVLFGQLSSARGPAARPSPTRLS